MIISYIKLGLRNISRRKLYTAINTIGLGVASAFCILVYWYVQHERSFDRFHHRVELLYRVETTDRTDATNEKEPGFSFLVKGAEETNTIITPPVLAVALREALPEIQYAVRIQPASETIVRVNNQSFAEKGNTAFVDQGFFTIFTFPLKVGYPATALAGRNQVVLSEYAAKKYFGTTDAIGKTLLLPKMNNLLLTVSGVAKDFPQASTFRYDLIIPREAVPNYEEEMNEGLNTAKDLLVLQLKAGTNRVTFQKKLDAFVRSYYATTLKEWAAFPGSEFKPENFHVRLRPFSEAHYNKSPGWGHYTNIKNMVQLSCLALVILIIACVNYVLLTLSGAISRAQEVGIRKTIGAERRQIVLQFYAETQLLAFVSVVVGFVLAVICLPLFNKLTSTTLELDHFSAKEVSAALLVLAFTLGLLAGIYPALVMSGLRPLNMMKKKATYRLNPYLSRILVITQFTVCIVLITSSLIIGRQLRYVNEAKLGFDTDQILTVKSPYGFDDMKSAYLLKDRLYQYARRDPAIAAVTTSPVPFQGNNNTNNHIIGGVKTMVEAFNVDYDYFDFYQIPIIQGRNFSPDIASDSAEIKLSEAQKIPGSSSAREAVVVNEMLYALLRKPELNVFNRELGGIIIGVCKDYHADDLTKNIAPAYHRIERHFVWQFSLKIKAGQNIPQAMVKIKNAWDRLTDKAPFSYTFLDENIAKSYEAYLRWMGIVTASCALAVMIGCLGLFGLSGITTLNRTKEIGIRKVLGASVRNLFLLLNKSTFIMALLSFIVAIPVTIYLTNEWLQNFAYRIKPGWSLFVLAGAVSLISALLAVSYHTIRTARANPVKSLHTE